MIKLIYLTYINNQYKMSIIYLNTQEDKNMVKNHLNHS